MAAIRDGGISVETNQDRTDFGFKCEVGTSSFRESETLSLCLIVVAKS